MGGEPDRRGPCRTPSGGNITVPIQHLGNSHQDPWFSKVAEGWPVSLPANGTDVEPFGESSVTINVTPPNGTEAGDVGTLNLRISNGDGTGSSQHQIPVRMSAEAAIAHGVRGWMLSSTEACQRRGCATTETI